MLLLTSPRRPDGAERITKFGFGALPFLLYFFVAALLIRKKGHKNIDPHLGEKRSHMAHTMSHGEEIYIYISSLPTLCSTKQFFAYSDTASGNLLNKHLFKGCLLIPTSYNTPTIIQETLSTDNVHTQYSGYIGYTALVLII